MAAKRSGSPRLTATVNEALGAAAAGNDLNSDAVITVVDLQIVIDAVLNLGCPAH